jgi:hypothetical protein
MAATHPKIVLIVIAVMAKSAFEVASCRRIDRVAGAS